MSKKKVVVIGAGPAGLAAAYQLNKDGFDVTVLELENFVGGISRTCEYKGNHIDIGGHRFFTKNSRVNNLWHEILPNQSAPSKDDIVLNREVELDQSGRDPEKEDEVLLHRQRVSRIYFLKKFFDYPISLKFRTFRNMGFFRTMKSGFGYIGSCIHKRPENSLEDFYINRFGKPLYQLFFESYTEKLWGVHPSNLSADWGAQRVKGLSLRKAFVSAITKPFKKKDKNSVETSLIESFEYPKYGPGQLYTVFAKQLREKGVKIIYNEEVNKFVVKDHVLSSVHTKSGHKYDADFVVSSMPIKDLFTSLGKDNVSDESYQVATELPYRDFITVGILLNKLKIKNKTKIKTINNIVPDTWIYVQERDVTMGRIQVFNNWSPYMVNDYLNTVWIGLEYFCNEGDKMWNESDENFISIAVDELVRMGIIESKENVLDATRIKVKKAYPAYFGSYTSFDKVKKELDGFKNLYCIGRNGQHRYNNMDHSMLTGLIAADLINSGSYNKEELWNVNSEKEYHETKVEKHE